MILEKLPKEFLQATPLVQVLEEAGYEAYFVGGSVRDVLLGKKIHDVDIATSAYPEEVKGLFKRTVDVGIEHGTVLVLWEDEQYEITTFRTESAYQDYRRPDEVTFVRSLAEDLKRRDFTINALAMDKQGEIVDLFDGMKDLEKGLIKAVGAPSERFEEDALRMMRALRFASQLGFTIEASTLEAIQEHHQLLSKISIERIQIEFVKLMLGDYRKEGLLPFLSTGCYDYCPGFKGKEEELKALIQLPPQVMSKEEMVWLVTLKVLEIPQEEWRSLLSQWKLSNHLSKVITSSLAGLDQRLADFWTRPWMYRLGESKLLLIEESLIYFDSRPQIKETKMAYESLPIHNLKELAVDGQTLLKELQRKPGPWIGQLLSTLEQKVLEEHLQNKEKELLDYARKELIRES